MSVHAAFALTEDRRLRAVLGAAGDMYDRAVDIVRGTPATLNQQAQRIVNLEAALAEYHRVVQTAAWELDRERKTANARAAS